MINDVTKPRLVELFVSNQICRDSIVGKLNSQDLKRLFSTTKQLWENDQLMMSAVHSLSREERCKFFQTPLDKCVCTPKIEATIIRN